MIDFGKLSGLAYRFRLIVDGLRRTVPEHQAKDRSSGPMVGLIWSSLGRRMARFERLLARIEAGIPDRVRPSRAGRAPVSRSVEAATEAEADAAPARALRLPTRNGWLMLMMPWVVAPYGSQLRYWLMDPDAEALVRSSRQLRRLLRPLLRSLSTDPLPECLLEPEEEPKLGAPASGAAPDDAAGEPAPEPLVDAEPAPEPSVDGATASEPGCQPSADAADDATEPTHAAAARVRKRRVGRGGVATTARGAVDAAQAGLPCAPQAAPAAQAQGCGFRSAPLDAPPPDWWRVQDERRRAALAIARGSFCRA